MYPRGQSVQRNNSFLKKIELSENVSFDSEFALAFENSRLKLRFLFFFLMPIFQRAEWVNPFTVNVVTQNSTEVCFCKHEQVWQIYISYISYVCVSRYKCTYFCCCKLAHI